MKKIHLTDGLPSDITMKDQSEEVKELTQNILKLSLESGLSYKEMNKALYLADKGLYESAISRCFLDVFKS